MILSRRWNSFTGTSIYSSTLTAILIVTGFGVALSPIFLFAQAPLLDFQNHLARYGIIIDAAMRRPGVPFYFVDWSRVSNNIGGDIAAYAFGRFCSAPVIATACLAISALLPPLGAIALNRCLFGRCTPYQVSLFILTWPLTVLAGFLNFQIGLGLALLAAALDVILKDKGWILWLARVTCGAIILIDHGVALAFYASLLAGLNFGSAAATPGRFAVASRLGRAAAASSSCLAPLVLTALMFGKTPGNHERAASLFTASWNAPPSSILKAALSPFLGYRTSIDLLILCFFVGLTIYGFVKSKVQYHSGLIAVGVLMILLVPAIPNTTSQGGWTDRRLPIMAALTLMSAVSLSFAKQSSASIYSVLAILMLAVKSDWIALNFVAADKLTQATYQAVSAAKDGALILPLQNTPTDAEIVADPLGRFIYKTEATYRHLPTMAIIWRHAFVPTLFSQNGVHPVAVHTRWSAMSDPEGGDLLSISALSRSAAAPGGAHYLASWKSNFDYVLLLNADYPDRHGALVSSGDLKLIRDSGFARLYLVRR